MNKHSTTKTKITQSTCPIKISAAVLSFMFLMSGAFAQKPPNPPEQPPSFEPLVAVQQEDYVKAREHFKTSLLRRGSSPQKWQPIAPPEGVKEVTYQSGALLLKAWVNQPPAAKKRKYPAVLFLHGGHAFDASDWQMSQPFRDAGFVVLTPILRGENGQPGVFSLFYDELDDVVAAAEYLHRQPYVDPDQLFVAGHSVGGTMTMLAAMSYKHFRAAASFSGSPDQVLFVKYAPGVREQVPFDPTDARELEMRSPLAYAASMRCPIRIYYGSSEPHFDLTSKKTAEIAREQGIDAQAVRVEGDHMSEVPEAMRRSIEFFRQVMTR